MTTGGSVETVGVPYRSTYALSSYALSYVALMTAIVRLGRARGQ